MQLTIVIIIIMASVAYAARRIYHTLNQVKNPCEGCAGCSLKGEIKKKTACPEKKAAKNLVERKK